MDLLSRNQRQLLRVVLGLGAILIANSAYLYVLAPAHGPVADQDDLRLVSPYGKAGVSTIAGPPLESPQRAIPKFYQAMLLVHIYGGRLLVILATVFALWHLKNALRIQNPRAIGLGFALLVLGLALWLTGRLILTEANSTANRMVFLIHRVLAIAMPGIYVAHRWFARSRPPTRRAVMGTVVVVVTWCVFLLAHFLLTRGIRGGEAGHVSQNVVAATDAMSERLDPFVPFKPGNVSDESSLFYPSPATLSSGGLTEATVLMGHEPLDSTSIQDDLERFGFVVREGIGAAMCGRCHAEIVEQWSHSAHRFSSFNNPFYKAAVDNLRSELNGEQRSQWCGGCHDPVLLFGGRMMGVIDSNSPESQAGLTCLACHAIDAIHGKEGNGNYNIADDMASPYLFASGRSSLERDLHDMLLKSRPSVHKRMMLKPFFREAEFCMTCHKVSLDTPINHYRWLRGQDDYDFWHDSGVARNAARTFYLPQEKRACRECHMPLETAQRPDVSAKGGMVRSHRFLAVNTALPVLRGDDAHIRMTEAFLRDRKVSVDVFAIRRDAGEPIPVADPQDVPLVAEEEIQVDVVVRNRGVGHTFPSGTSDSNEAWIRFDVTDDRGRVYYSSGGMSEDGTVDPEAHFYKTLFVDNKSRAAAVRDPQNFHAVIYSRLIGPGVADVVRYRFTVPPEAEGGTLVVAATLLWRKFNRGFTDYVIERIALPHPGQSGRRSALDLPVTEIDSARVTLPVVSQLPAAAATRPVADRAHWPRFNDYGIAHFLQEDFRTAAWAFARVDEVRPDLPDGPRNLARVAIREGRLEDAYQHLEVCEERVPGDPQTAWHWGMAKKKDGLYSDAIYAFRRVIAFFPEDRSAWRELGRTHYLAGDYRASLNAYLEVLAIEPEDRIAHYHRMLCYKALGMPVEAAEAEKAYRKYKLDESAAEVTQRYRLENPIDNLTSQKIPVYRLNTQ